MNMMPDFNAGRPIAPALSLPPQTTSLPAHGPGLSAGGWLRRATLYRKVLNSDFVEPFRRLLSPLILWILRLHLSIHNELGGDSEVPINTPSMTVIVLSILFGPLIFLMLLPAFLVLVPAALLLGALGVSFSSVQTYSNEHSSS